MSLYSYSQLPQQDYQFVYTISLHLPPFLSSPLALSQLLCPYYLLLVCPHLFSFSPFLHYLAQDPPHHRQK
ncbi:hypothetical protein RchiOBHm_Chr5g0011051 [Rosa chinensis]|uniref:Uncharacterized protein n=1 Tax=Rosa chinensis TaxID=74649 RepID=A0A2P6Q4S6_ROSCH|nr:hypothetical protein RchiOBHm_Chr5g0011051 [Rosa chinensis]